MKLKSIKNTSKDKLRLKLRSGAEFILPPDVEVGNVDIINLDEVRGSSIIIGDLGEINENSGKTKLWD